MAWDDDGSLAGYYTDTNYDTPVEYSEAEQEGLNRDVTNYNVPDYNQYGFWLIFPELREVDGVSVALNDAASHTYPLHTSTNTTNAVDGTFVQQFADIPSKAGYTRAGHRTIDSMAVSNVRGVRMQGPTGDFPGHQDFHRHFHMYGEISSGQTPDRLIFIDELTGLEFVLPKDYEEVPRGSSEDIEIRIRNISSTLTANTIQYTAESLSLNSAAWYTFTLPGGSTYAATQQIASLAPSTTSGLITLRRITPAAENVGLHVARTYLNVASWT